MDRKRNWWQNDDEDDDFMGHKQKQQQQLWSARGSDRRFDRRTGKFDDSWGPATRGFNRDMMDDRSPLQEPCWEEMTLTPFEKNFYTEHPDVINRTQVSG